jgi:2-oxoisovalerate dehydrogenase E1 component
MTSREQLVRYAFMLLTRRFDARFENLLKTGRVSKWYSEVGNEATTVPAGLALEAGDVLCTLHRDLGAILAVYLDPARTFPGLGFGAPDGRRPEPTDLLDTLACQLMGKDRGFSHGIERSFHYGYMAPDAGIFHVGMISHLGAMIPVAAGCGLARRLEGTDRVALNFIGEGGTSTGDFHEGLNMAAVWKLPLILVIENNHFAFSTPTSAQYVAERLADRGVGYGVPAVTVDGTDPEALTAAVRKAVEWARQGEGPTLIEAMLGRMRGHSEGDDSLKVVPDEDLQRYMAGDPVPGYARRLRAAGVLTDDLESALDERVEELVEGSIDRALAAEPPQPRTARRPALAPAPGFEALDPSQAVLRYAQAAGGESAEPVTYVEAIHQALTEEMERDSHVLLMGQDIGVFEGAFRATRGLHARWPERVRDTPIAESGTLGIAVGLALFGYRPVVEMQFADFITCGFNQLVNVAAKIYYRWQVPCPVVVRLPSGGGVGAGPFHSQNPEAWFTHVAGLKVVCPATAIDAKALLKAAVRDPNPVVFCEHKYLYRRIKEVLPVDLAPAPLGEARVARRGGDLTLIGYGVTTWTCLDAAEQLEAEGIQAEVIDLRTLVPLDVDTLVESVRRTSRVVIAHEAPLTSGFGAEVAARLTDAAFAWLDAPIRRVAFADRPVPYARVLEQELSPTKEKILHAAREVLAY